MSAQLKKAILVATTTLACNLISTAHSVELGNVAERARTGCLLFFRRHQS